MFVTIIMVESFNYIFSYIISESNIGPCNGPIKESISRNVAKLSPNLFKAVSTAAAPTLFIFRNNREPFEISKDQQIQNPKERKVRSQLVRSGSSSSLIFSPYSFPRTVNVSLMRYFFIQVSELFDDLAS